MVVWQQPAFAKWYCTSRLPQMARCRHQQGKGSLQQKQRTRQPVDVMTSWSFRTSSQMALTFAFKFYSDCNLLCWYAGRTDYILKCSALTWNMPKVLWSSAHDCAERWMILDIMIVWLIVLYTIDLYRTDICNLFCLSAMSFLYAYVHCFACQRCHSEWLIPTAQYCDCVLH